MASSAAPSAWRGQARWASRGTRALRPAGPRRVRLCRCPVRGCRHPRSSSRLCRGRHGNSVIDLPLLNPRGRIEARGKICWSLNSFQVMAHVSGNKSMRRRRQTQRRKETFALLRHVLLVTFKCPDPSGPHFCLASWLSIHSSDGGGSGTWAAMVGRGQPGSSEVTTV